MRIDDSFTSGGSFADLSGLDGGSTDTFGGLGPSTLLAAASPAPGSFAALSAGPAPRQDNGPRSTGTIGPDPGFFAAMSGIAKSDLPLADKLGMAWDNAKYYGRQVTDDYKLPQRAEGALQMAGGAGLFATSLALDGTGLGATVGVPLAFYAGDQIGTGFNQLRTGEAQDSLTTKLAKGVTGTPLAGVGLDLAVEAGTSFLSPATLATKGPRLVSRAIDAAEALPSTAAAATRLAEASPNLPHIVPVGLRPRDPSMPDLPLVPSRQLPVFSSGSLQGGTHEAGWLAEQLGNLPHGFQAEVHGYLKPGMVGGFAQPGLGSQQGKGYWSHDWRMEHLNNNLLAQTGRRPDEFKIGIAWAGGAEDVMPWSARTQMPVIVGDNGPKIDFRKVVDPESYPEPFQTAPLDRSYKQPLDIGEDLLLGHSVARITRDMYGPLFGPAVASQLGEMARSATRPLRDAYAEQVAQQFYKGHRDLYRDANLVLDTVVTGPHAPIYSETLPEIRNAMMLPERVDGLDINHRTAMDATLDQLNYTLGRTLQPDGTVLNPWRELQAGRMTRAQFDDLMTYRPPDLHRFDEDTSGAFARGLGDLGIGYDALARLRDAGALRLPREGGIELLGTDPGGKLRSVMTLPPDLSGQSIRGFGTFRPVLPGDPRHVQVVPDALDALRLWGQRGSEGPTIVIDSVESGRFTSMMQGGPLLGGAQQVTVPPMQPGLYGPLGDVAQKARYDQILDLIGRDKIRFGQP
jgi:hypothetical protein